MINYQNNFKVLFHCHPIVIVFYKDYTAINYYGPKPTGKSIKMTFTI